MPLHKIHKTKQAKNIAILVVLIIFITLVFFLGVVKFAGPGKGHNVNQHHQTK